MLIVAGSTVTGVLKGFDQLLNLVLDDVVENVQTGECQDDSFPVMLLISMAESGETARTLGLVVCRGPTITLLSPVDGFEEIANPFAAQEA